MKVKPLSFCSGLLLSGVLCSVAHADLDKVYHPYVEPLEREMEWRSTHSSDPLDQHKHQVKVGYGQAVLPHVFVEAYVLGEKKSGQSAEDEAYEVEVLWQLSEQGEYVFDVALMFEAEREVADNISEISTVLLLEKELGPSSLAVNLGLSYEFGSGIDNEYDRLLRAQWRYRYHPLFEPAIELHLDEYDKAIGPAAMGLIRLSGAQKLKWEAAVLFALDDETPASTFKLSLEYEF